jgi:hypothetical protein
MGLTFARIIHLRWSINHPLKTFNWRGLWSVYGYTLCQSIGFDPPEAMWGVFCWRQFAQPVRCKAIVAAILSCYIQRCPHQAHCHVFNALGALGSNPTPSASLTASNILRPTGRPRKPKELRGSMPASGLQPALAGSFPFSLGRFSPNLWTEPQTLRKRKSMYSQFLLRFLLLCFSQDS